MGILHVMLRLILFLITNLAVMMMFGVVLSFTGIHSSSLAVLMTIVGLCGFCGSFISLLMSKIIALRTVSGKLIDKPRNETEFWLVHTVRQQSQQAKIAMPQVAIYQATDTNAFATGASRDASLVAVSTGLLHHMNREEAEAVIAHEISHIAIGDMVTMTLFQGVVNVFVIFVSRLLAQLSAWFMSSDHEAVESVHGSPLFISSMILELVFSELFMVPPTAGKTD